MTVIKNILKYASDTKFKIFTAKLINNAVIHFIINNNESMGEVWQDDKFIILFAYFIVNYDQADNAISTQDVNIDLI